MVNARVKLFMFKYLTSSIDRLLAYGEGFLETDTRYLFKNSFWVGLGKLVSVFGAFALSVAYARYLPKAVYGDYRYVLSILSIAGIFAIPGMGTAMARSIARGFEGTFRKGSRLIFLSSFGISIVGLSVSAFFYHEGKNNLALAFLITSIFIPFVEGLGNWRTYFDGKRMFKEKTFLNIIDQIFYTTSMLAGVASIYFLDLSTQTSLLVLLASYCVGEGVPNTYFYLQTLKKVAPKAPGESGALRYGLHLSITEIPSIIATYLDAVLLHLFIGPEALAIYSFAIALPEQLKAFLGITVDVTFPKLATQTQHQPSLENLKKTLLNKVVRASILTMLIVGGYILMAPLIYSYIFPRYIQSILPSQVFALSLIVFPFGIFNTALKAEGDLQKIYIYSSVSPFIQIILLLGLIPFYGIWGAIIGRIIGRTINNILPFYFFKK